MFFKYRKKAFFLIFTLTAPVSIAYFVHNYGINVPFWEQWKLVDLLEKAYAGEVALTDIWAQNSEHRAFFPLLIMLALAFLTDWNIMYELYTNLILAGVTLVFLYSLLH